MDSRNHQYMQFSDQVKRRYVKTRIEPITGWRLNPENAVNPNERIDFLLATPDSNVNVTPYGEGQATKVEQTGFTYEAEVLELYSDNEIRSFERMNRLLIENGLLVEYSETAPEVDRVNALSDIEIRKIARLKTKDAFTRRVAGITSTHTLNTLLEAVEDADAPMSYAKIIKERVNELNKN
jgi:hypothetical protein